VVGVIVVIVAVLAFRRPDGELPQLHEELVAAAAQAGIGGSFHLSDVADFAWDRAHVFPPYSSGLVSDELGFGWSPLPPAYRLVFDDLYLANEGLNLVVFVEGADTVTGWSLLGTEYLDQAYLELTRDGSPVVIERDADLLFVELPPFGPDEDAYLLAAPER
jgi:hypothetical protein